MIRGTGIDVIEVARIETAIANPRFYERVYTAPERDAIAAYGSMSAQRAAGFFAAKEAVAKALGCGFDGFGFADIEIAHDDRGAPVCRLHGGAKARLTAIYGARLHVSISHIPGVAVASAIIEG